MFLTQATVILHTCSLWNIKYLGIFKLVIKYVDIITLILGYLVLLN